MRMTARDLRCIVLMKVGYHTDETLDDIIERKANEEEECGKIFWGYGGTVCHPLTQIKPFVRRALDQALRPMLVMAFTPSRFAKADSEWAREMSVDNKVWTRIPASAYVKGSRYAIICRNFERVNMQIDLRAYEVAVGQKKGMQLSEYIRHRVDKACAFLVREPHQEGAKGLGISYVADLVEPYAVFVR